MSIHHTTVKKELGNCLMCGKPILMLWNDEKETSGQSERYTNFGRKGSVHYSCNGGKSLYEINEERSLKK